MNYRGNHDCHLLLCLPWDNWTLPERELGWSEIVKIIIILVMIIITIMILNHDHIANHDNHVNPPDVEKLVLEHVLTTKDCNGIPSCYGLSEGHRYRIILLV